MALKSRIAPTPSGLLHQGNAYNFLLTQHIVRSFGGTIRLRIDDLDAPRARAEYIQDIFESLQWLGITCDEGPRNADEHYAQFSQQLRTKRYEAVLDQLIATGNVFACTCSRAEIAQNSPDGRYSGACLHKNIPLDTPGVALRVQIPNRCNIRFQDCIMGSVEVDVYHELGHFVIRRRDGIPAYHLASLVDDWDYSINCIVRGKDLLQSTAAQLYLASLIGYEEFAAVRFYHHPLLIDELGRKLSKSSGSESLQYQRQQNANVAIFLNQARAWIEGLM